MSQKPKLKLEQCIVPTCRKTFSESDGNMNTKICNVCQKRKTAEADKAKMLAEKMANLSKKTKPKANRTCKDMEKLAKVVS